MGLVFLIVAVGFPLVLIWTVSYVAGSIRSIRSEAIVLRHSMEQIKQAVESGPKNDPVGQEQLQKKLAEIATLTQQTEKRLSELAAKSVTPAGGETGPRMSAAALAVPENAPKDVNQSALPLQAFLTYPYYIVL